jgi:hypothetical protein
MAESDLALALALARPRPRRKLPGINLDVCYSDSQISPKSEFIKPSFSVSLVGHGGCNGYPEVPKNDEKNKNKNKAQTYRNTRGTISRIRLTGVIPAVGVPRVVGLAGILQRSSVGDYQKCSFELIGLTPGSRIMPRGFVPIARQCRYGDA